jgi:hypothetical protein
MLGLGHLRPSASTLCASLRRYLFVDGIAERLRPGAKREPVLAAWGCTVEGRRVLLHLMAGSKEDAETNRVSANPSLRFRETGFCRQRQRRRVLLALERP